MTEKYMTIREMCMEYGVTARTLRFYEAKELIFPIELGEQGNTPIKIGVD